MKKDLISVIIPVYNVERYLAGCLESVLAQSYPYWEAICINDGSLDSSEQILLEYAARDERIKIIKQNNAGLSAVRNRGVGLASGEYVFFLDADDYIHPQTLEILLYALQKYDVAVSAAMYLRTHQVYADTSFVTMNTNTVPIVLYKEPVYELFNNQKNIGVVACNKLYRKELVTQQPFQVGLLHEDEIFTPLVLEQVSSIAVVQQELYYYYQNHGSIMGRFGRNRLNSYLHILEFLCEHFAERTEILNLIKRKKLISIFSQCYKGILLMDDLPEREEFKNILKNTALQMRKRGILAYKNLSPDGWLKLYKILHF